MKKLGSEPLTGAEKQRRHRQKVKARLAEAERLRILFAESERGFLAGFETFYDAILDEIGASSDERAALKTRATALQTELRGAFEARLRDELENLREARRKRTSSLLARLGAAKAVKG